MAQRRQEGAKLSRVRTVGTGARLQGAPDAGTPSGAQRCSGSWLGCDKPEGPVPMAGRQTQDSEA